MLIALRRLVLWQLGTVLLAALVGLGIAGVAACVAILYGGGVAAVNLLLLRWRWQQGLRDYHCDAQRHLKGFYRSSLERFFVVGILLAVWFVLIKSAPLAMLTGFVVGQLAGLTVSVVLRERN